MNNQGKTTTEVGTARFEQFRVLVGEKVVFGLVVWRTQLIDIFTS